MQSSRALSRLFWRACRVAPSTKRGRLIELMRLTSSKQWHQIRICQVVQCYPWGHSERVLPAVFS